MCYRRGVRVANITAAVAAILWFGCVLMGRYTASGMAKSAGGNLSISQVDLYILLPLVILAALLLCAWVCNFCRNFYSLLGLTAGASIVYLPFFIALYGGGV